MVASLVIMLPAYHRGGTLVINHHGEKKMFQSSRGSLQQATCVAFYADCYHEVKPVTEGHHVSLTFNLMLTDNDSTSKENDQPTQKVADIVAGLITDWQGPLPRNYKDYTTSVIEQLCQIALAIQNPEHATALLSPFSLSILSVPVADQLVLLAQNYGVPWALDLLKLWGKNSRHDRSII